MLGEMPGATWAADNECYSLGEAFDMDRYLRFLWRVREYPGRCLFAAVPDVVGDAEATHQRWLQYAPAMRRVGLPLAYVAQDGLDRVPRVGFACLFVGGTTEYKLGQGVAGLVKAAKRAGKWVHAGRVNSRRRILHFARLGADSFDGTGPARRPAHVRWTVDFLRGLRAQGRFA
jgi:hypothetical protein